jgi:hypothetical protein
MNPGPTFCGIALRAALIGLAGCQMPGIREGDRVPPSVPAEISPGTPAGTTLALLQAQLDSALAAGLDGDGPAHLDRAEAISDRLLESRLPFAWISAESYSVEARLRQIQTRTDRIESLRAGGARGEDVLAEIRDLRDLVARAATELAAGGSAAPPPVQQLLVTLDTARR